MTTHIESLFHEYTRRYVARRFGLAIPLLYKPLLSACQAS
jgi:hypothetical protein